LFALALYIELIMATREETFEQAEFNFSRSLSNRSIPGASKNRYEHNDIDIDVDADEDDALVEELLTADKEKRMNSHAHAFNNTDTPDMEGNLEDEPELIAVRSVPASSPGADYEYEEEEDNNQQEQDNEGGEDVDPYLNPLCKTAIAVGSTSIGYSRAKMLGLCDASGKVKLGSSGIIQPLDTKTKQRLDKISKPREIDTENIVAGIEDSDNEARQRAKREAEKAMRNPKCGYDFVNRLKERGDFLDRAGDKGGNGAEKAKMDVEEQDYNARLDKLACPKCKKTQSFDEFIEKRRFCSQCKEKFTKLNMCNVHSFEKRMKEAQKVREEKLAAVDASVYKPQDNTKKFVIGVGIMNTDDGKLPKSRSGSADVKAVVAASGGKVGPKAVEVLSELAAARNTASANAELFTGPSSGASSVPKRPPSGINRKVNGTNNSDPKADKKAATMSEEEIRSLKFKKLAMYDENSGAPSNKTTMLGPGARK
jgi:ribosomal protein L37AE/L43A